MSLPIRPSSPFDSGKYYPLPADDSEVAIADAGYSRLDVDDSRTALRWKGSKKHWLPVAFLTVAVSLFSGLAGFYIGQTRVLRVAGDLRSSYEDTPWGAVHSFIQRQSEYEYFLTTFNLRCFFADALKEEAITYETRTFSGHFSDYSEYQGPPNPSLDAKWKPISARKYSSIRLWMRKHSLIQRSI